MTDEPAESIYTLFNKVKAHPDFAGGTIWTRDDVAWALFQPTDEDEDGFDFTDVPDEARARVTDDMLDQSRKTMESYIFNGAYSWEEAMQDNIDH